IQREGLAGSHVGYDVLVGWSIGMLVVGLVCGFIVGWARESIVVGLTLGVVLGGLVGAACIPLLLIPAALTALVDLAWVFISLLLLTGGTIAIERRQNKRRLNQSYVDILDDTP